MKAPRTMFDKIWEDSTLAFATADHDLPTTPPVAGVPVDVVASVRG